MKLEEIARQSADAARASVTHLDPPDPGRNLGTRAPLVLGIAVVALVLGLGAYFVATSGDDDGESTRAGQPAAQADHFDALLDMIPATVLMSDEGYGDIELTDLAFARQQAGVADPAPDATLEQLTTLADAAGTQDAPLFARPIEELFGWRAEFGVNAPLATRHAFGGLAPDNIQAVQVEISLPDVEAAALADPYWGDKVQIERIGSDALSLVWEGELDIHPEHSSPARKLGRGGQLFVTDSFAIRTFTKTTHDAVIATYLGEQPSLADDDRIMNLFRSVDGPDVTLGWVADVNTELLSDGPYPIQSTGRMAFSIAPDDPGPRQALALDHASAADAAATATTFPALIANGYLADTDQGLADVVKIESSSVDDTVTTFHLRITSDQTLPSLFMFSDLVTFPDRPDAAPQQQETPSSDQPASSKYDTLLDVIPASVLEFDDFSQITLGDTTVRRAARGIESVPARDASGEEITAYVAALNGTEPDLQQPPEELLDWRTEFGVALHRFDRQITVWSGQRDIYAYEVDVSLTEVETAVLADPIWGDKATIEPIDGGLSIKWDGAETIHPDLATAARTLGRGGQLFVTENLAVRTNLEAVHDAVIETYLGETPSLREDNGLKGLLAATASADGGTAAFRPSAPTRSGPELAPIALASFPRTNDPATPQPFALLHATAEDAQHNARALSEILATGRRATDDTPLSELLDIESLTTDGPLLVIQVRALQEGAAGSLLWSDDILFG